MKRKKRVNTKKRPTKTPIIVKVSLIIIVFFVLFATVFKITELILTNKTNDFPKLEISLKNVPLEEIDGNSKDIKYPNNTATLTVDNEATSYKNIEIKGRGNSTWSQNKKPYQIKLNEKASLFGHKAAKKWILLSSSFDGSFLKNDLAFKIADIITDDFTPKGDFVELIFDNLYHGLYYLTEKIEVSESRIDLSSPTGALIELDLYNGGGKNYIYTKDGAILYIKDAVNEDNLGLIKSEITASLTLLKTAVATQNYDLIQSIVDIDSFAKYYLLNEFVANPEAYTASFFLYKDGDKDTLHAGPGWDFDLSFSDSSVTVKSSEKNLAPDNTEKNQQNVISTLIYNLLDIPEFETRVKEIYQETLSGKGEELLDYIKSQAEYIKPAALRDQERWKLKTNFDEEVDSLIDWVAKRYNYFEQIYGEKPQKLTQV